MVIDDTYTLGPKQYNDVETVKHGILVGHSYTPDMRFVTGWKTRYAGAYRHTAAYSIDRDGTIYRHFDDKFYADYADLKDFDSRYIGVNLVNEGHYIKDHLNNRYVSWRGREYRADEVDVKQKNWRGHSYWNAYTDAQLQSLRDLYRHLRDDWGWEGRPIPTNTMATVVEERYSVLYRSNLLYYHCDPNPTFDFTLFD